MSDSTSQTAITPSAQARREEPIFEVLSELLTLLAKDGTAHFLSLALRALFAFADTDAG